MIPKRHLFRNPITEYFAWLMLSFKYIFHKDIIIEYMAIVTNSKLGKFTKVSKNTVVAKSTLGDYSYIGSDSKVNNTVIGKFCSIASGVIISTGMHPTEFVSTHPSFYSIQKQCGRTFSNNQKFKEFEKVEIGNDVWIGTNSIILDGVIIGNGAIIAANSVVNKDVEAYSIVGGSPARHIKYRFDHQTIELLESFKWWNQSEEWIKKHAEDFIDIKKFIHAINKIEYIS